LFLKKWQIINNDSLNAFLQYFKSEWVSSSNCCWYEGACDRIPKQNNALEATNLVIKTHHTLRERLSLSHYLNNAESMIKNWSIDRTKHEFKFQTTVDIDSNWQLAYTWVKESGCIFRYVSAPGLCFVVTKLRYQYLVNDMNMKFLNAQTLDFDFDSLNQTLSHVLAMAKIPNYCKNMIKIGEKPKRGRIPKSKKALEKQ
jgi:hypothetical protein